MTGLDYTSTGGIKAIAWNNNDPSAGVQLKIRNNLALVGRTILLLLACTALAACGDGGGSAAHPAPPAPPPPPVACNDAVEYCGAVPGNADPCTDTEYWPLSSSSGLRPLMVHYQRTGDEAKALEMIALLEESWLVQVDSLGFTAPLDDQGACGPDGRYDVFIWPGIDGAFVSGINTNPATPHTDWTTYMAIDVSGATGGVLLDTYMAHELNHALQASDDWTEDGQHYEAGATFAEALVYPDENDWFFEIRDFQNNPHWSLFYDDFGATWYTYAAAMYLHYLYDRFFTGDPGFYARIWRGTRSNVGDARPDYFDALRNVLLIERGVTLDDSVAEFMQWRWFVADQDDGAHFTKGAEWPKTVAVTDVDAADIPSDLGLDAMVYGANYFRITNGSAVPVSFNATITSADVDVSWRLLNVVSSDIVAPLTLMPGEEVALVGVVLPVQEIWTGNLNFEQKIATLELTPSP